MRSWWKVFIAVIAIALAGCPQTETPEIPEEGGEPDAGWEGEEDTGGDAGGHDVEEGSDVGVPTRELRLIWEEHAVNPPGFLASVGESFSFVVGGAVEDTSVSVELGAGVFTLQEPADLGDPVMPHRALRAFEGTHSIGELRESLFVSVREERFSLSLDGEILQVERLDEESPGRLFDEALEALATATAAESLEITRDLQRALREAEASPLDAGARGRFFVGIGSEDGIAPQLRGSFNDWEARAEHELAPLAGRLWGRFVEGLEGHHQYKVVYGDGDAWFTDFSNPHIEWDGFNTGGLGAFNSIVNPEARPAGTGRLYWLPEVVSPQLENTREVYVYLPASYDAGAPGEHELLILHDGNESISRGQFHLVADEVETEKILAFVALPSQEVRMAEYTVGTEGALGDAYGDFLVETLLPELRGRFRVAEGRESLGLGGASLGGLISLWTASRYPEVFGFAAGMSSSFFWGDGVIFDRFNDVGCQDVRFYIDSGSPQDNYQVTLEMRDLMEALECDFTHVVETGGLHDWAFWRGRVGAILQ